MNFLKTVFLFLMSINCFLYSAQENVLLLDAELKIWEKYELFLRSKFLSLKYQNQKITEQSLAKYNKRINDLKNWLLTSEKAFLILMKTYLVESKDIFDRLIEVKVRKDAKKFIPDNVESLIENHKDFFYDTLSTASTQEEKLKRDTFFAYIQYQYLMKLQGTSGIEKQDIRALMSQSLKYYISLKAASGDAAGFEEVDPKKLDLATYIPLLKKSLESENFAKYMKSLENDYEFKLREIPTMWKLSVEDVEKFIFTRDANFIGGNRMQLSPYPQPLAPQPVAPQPVVEQVNSINPAYIELIELRKAVDALLEELKKNPQKLTDQKNWGKVLIGQLKALIENLPVDDGPSKTIVPFLENKDYQYYCQYYYEATKRVIYPSILFFDEPSGDYHKEEEIKTTAFFLWLAKYMIKEYTKKLDKLTRGDTAKKQIFEAAINQISGFLLPIIQFKSDKLSEPVVAPVVVKPVVVEPALPEPQPALPEPQPVEEPVSKKEPMFSKNVTFLGMGVGVLGIAAGAVLLHSKGYFDSAIEKITDIWTRTVTPYVSEVINFWPGTVTPFLSSYIFKNPFVKH